MEINKKCVICKYFPTLTNFGDAIYKKLFLIYRWIFFFNIKFLFLRTFFVFCTIDKKKSNRRICIKLITSDLFVNCIKIGLIDART